MSILVTRSLVRDPNDYDALRRMFGEDLAYWPANEILPGASTLLVSAPLELYVLEGEFTLTLDGAENRVAAGDRVRLPAGATVQCQALAPASFRSRALDVAAIDAALLSVANRMAAAAPPSGFGSFERIGPADELPEGGILLSSSARAAPRELRPVGALPRALFSLSSTELALRTVNLNEEATDRLELASLWGPRGVRWSDGDPVPLALVTRLHALELPALRHIGPHCRFTRMGVERLERIELSLRLDRRAPLERADELFVSHGGSLYRWIDDAAGAPVDVAVRALFALPTPAEPAVPTSEADAFLEQLFATLWQDDDVALGYMQQPGPVPYPVRFLTLHAPIRPSAAFCARWQIAAICAGPQSAFTPEASVEVDFAAPASWPAAGGFSVRWRYFHETACWTYELRTHDGKPVLHRELREQYD